MVSIYILLGEEGRSSTGSIIQETLLIIEWVMLNCDRVSSWTNGRKSGKENWNCLAMDNAMDHCSGTHTVSAKNGTVSGRYYS